MQCGGCSADNRADASFCRSCGQPLELRCPECGADQEADAAFCDACGARLATVLRADPVEDSSASLAARVEAEAAERRLVTVLFADAQGSTSLTEQVGDEAMYRLMQGCVARMQSAVEKHRGTVTQFRGDGIMALFGAPLALENAAVEAVSAALEMQESLAQYAAEVEEASGTPCAFRIGVNTGPVVVGRFGDETLVDYTAIGDTANVAARLEQAAGAGEVYLSDATERAVRDYIECESVGTVEAKGKPDGVRTHRAVRRLAVRGRLDAAARRGLSTFVGREDELTLLAGMVSRLSDGHGQVVALSGEAGIGKSRLLHELHQRLPDEVEWFEGRASATERDAPLHVVADLFRRAIGVLEHESHAQIAARIEQRAQNWSPEVADRREDLVWLLGADAPTVDALDPKVRRVRLRDTVVMVMRDASSRRPLVVALEDLHWADEASLEVVGDLAASVADLPVLLVLTHRPERALPLGDRPWITRLALDGLVSGAVARLAASGAATELSERARALVAERSGGNPLFVEELTAALIEGGGLVEREGVLDVLEAGTVDIPESLHDVVLARIDRLEAEARRALQLASVIGREFTRRILDRISAMPGALDDHLAELEALELIRQRSLMPEVAYLFKHAVVHDVTYSTLLDERRAALHRIVAEATEDLYAETIGDHAEALARHWSQAGRPERALPHLQEAARRAAASYSLARAAHLWGQAGEAAAAIGDDRARLDAASMRVEALLPIDPRAGFEAAEEYLAVATALESVVDQVGAHHACGLTSLLMHDFERSQRHGEAAERLLPEVPPEARIDLEVAIRSLESTRRAVLGDPTVFDELPEIEAAAPKAASRIRGTAIGMASMAANWTDQHREPGHWLGEVDTYAAQDLLIVRWSDGIQAAKLGRYREALAVLEETLDLSTKLDELIIRGRVLNTIGWIHGDLGDHAGAEFWNHESIGVAEELGLPDPEIESNAQLNLAESLLAQDRPEEAAELLDGMERVVRSPTDVERWMLWRYSLRWLAIAGELAAAGVRAGDPSALAEECIQRATETRSPRYRVRGLIVRAQAAARDGAATAADAASAASAAAEQIGTPPLLWRAKLAEHEITGSPAAARDALRSIDGVLEHLADHPLAEHLRASPMRRRALAGSR